MKRGGKCIFVILVFQVLFVVVRSSLKDSVKYVDVHSVDGIWKTKTKWNYQWIREWIPKQILVPLWKKVWTPVIVREWIPSEPLPKHQDHSGWTPH